MSLLIVGISVLIYFSYRIPSGVEPMGGDGETIARYSLIAAALGAITAFLGVIKEVISMFRKKKE
ncbi:hypothetical protein [Candidatus Rhodobacter oscarellae]|uniref:hypothetical protein n=1 Tax=Candidatus Rhodobacter oscarellae TaxID=1675527 RepID=UPI00128EE359|nr:hypothetical protein [Candidatus Rhodobacter lobularis]